jgi:putative heme-binding domain-containing protein
MAHNDAERFTHTFVIYGGGALPEKYDGQLFGVEPLQGRIVLSDVQRDRSSFKTRDIAHAVTTSDKYFKPVDIKVGPDGALYIADWYDRQVTHTRNYEGNIDKSNGRIYRLKKKGPVATISRTHGSPSLRSENRWERQAALRSLAAKGDKSEAVELRATLEKEAGQTALEALWARNLIGDCTEKDLVELTAHRDPHVRLWAVRLLGDRSEISHESAQRLANLGASEPHVEARSQLASTAKRLPARQSLPIVRNLLTHNEDADDIHIPLLLWWAIESKAESDTDAVLAMLKDTEFWKLKIASGTILDRLMKRYAMLGTQTGYKICARILSLAPSRAEAKSLVASFESASKGRAIGRLPPELRDEIAKSGGESLAFRLRRRDSTAAKEAFELLRSATPANFVARRNEELIEVLGEVRYSEAPPILFGLLKSQTNQAILKATISALQIYEEPGIPELIITCLARLEPETRLTAFNVLASRTAWAQKLLEAIKRADVPTKSVPPEIIEKLRSDEKLTAQVDDLFGQRQNLDKNAVDEKLRKYAATIQSGNGSPFEGYKNYNLACSSCHKLFGDGGQIGPDLTTYQRDDLDSMLMHVVNPSGEIREGYENVLIETKDGRNLSGFLAERYEDAVVLRGLDGETTLIKKDNIATTKSAGGSLMPEGLLDGFDEQQIRDLFAYLRSTQPLVKQR